MSNICTEKKKAFLRGYRAAQYELKAAEEELEEYNTSILYPSTLYDKAPTKKGHKDDLSKYMGKLDDLKNECIKKRDTAIIKKHEIELCIDKLECVNQREVLKLRYLKWMGWERIIEEMPGYSDRQIYRLHGRALYNLEI